jgi:uncharacterized protein
VIFSPSAPYILPLGVFFALLLFFARVWSPPALVEQVLFVGIMALVLWFASRSVMNLHIQHWLGSALLGLAIFVLWIAPDLLFPGYRHHWMFQNAITGGAPSAFLDEVHRAPAVLAVRALRAVAIVPIVEELFWRSWLMRWLIAPDFWKIPLGAYRVFSFWAVAILFAAEHGPYWDVGLLAGILFNAWMLRTKSLGDLILAHAVANAGLSLYVIAAGKWEYWQ